MVSPFSSHQPSPTQLSSVQRFQKWRGCRHFFKGGTCSRGPWGLEWSSSCVAP
jgi:hypothetical protein